MDIVCHPQIIGMFAATTRDLNIRNVEIDPETRKKIGTSTMDSVLCSEQLDQARVSRHRGRVFSITARKGGTCTMKGADRFMPWTSFHSGMIWMANLFDVQLR